MMIDSWPHSAALAAMAERSESGVIAVMFFPVTWGA
jgi:hypothetical protein